jgi:predicted Zn-dependent peptidase
MTDSEYRKSILPSGITLLTERMPDRGSISVGVWVRCGARDEPQERLGISHFIEHMMFKGTERRDARQIAQSLESLGGHLDAFTAREQVCYYARALSEHLSDVVDVLADIVCRSTFADAEIVKEKSVVREEIYSCDDNPEDRIAEMSSEQVWAGHPLGKPILGTVQTVDALDADALRHYFRSRYRGDHLLVAAAGGLEHDRLAELVEAAFAPPCGEVRPLSSPPPAVPEGDPVRHEVRDDLQQLNLALGARGIPYADERRYALHVLNTLLGGGMSSRLFQGVREEAGLAYSVYSVLDFYRDAGMIGIHLGVAPERGRDALRRVRDELVRLTDEGPGEDEVEAARAQLRGGMLIGQESVSNRMHHLAHDDLYRGRFFTIEEDVTRVMAVTRADVTTAARAFLAPGRFNVAALGPAPGGPIGADDWAGAAATR